MRRWIPIRPAGHTGRRCRRLLLLASVIGCAGSACSRSSAEDTEARVRGELADVLDVEVASISCPGSCAAGSQCTCEGQLGSGEPFALDVLGMDGQGKPLIKPHGSKKFEYQVARGFRDQLRTDVESITCPGNGDVSAGFACQVVVAGDEPVTVRISAAPQPDRFLWEAEGLLMPAKIERGVQKHLAAQGKAATVDCGSTLRKSRTGDAFTCDIRYTAGAVGVVKIHVRDTEGNIEILYVQNKTYP